MTRLIPTLLSITLALSLLLVAVRPSLADTPPDAPGVVVIPAMETASAAAPVVTPAPVAPHDAVTNPAEHPVQAWDDAKATKKGGWPLLVYFVLVALTKALAYGRDKLHGAPVIGWIARRLSIGKTAMIVAGLGALAAAGYDVLAAGGSIVAALMASGLALAGAMHSTTKGAEIT
jgi:hypothetical protein